MRFIGLISLFAFMAFQPIEDPSFKKEQLEYERVLDAFEARGGVANARLKAVNIDPQNYDLFIRAFKFEEDLEVWAKNKNAVEYIKVVSYKFCENVGELGPKRKEGDKQIPEGIYSLSKFNPNSNYHLSLKVNYPNASDSILSNKQSPGGMIFIHGGCKTVGCIPITDDFIKELYILAVQAKDQGQEDIPIHIFPFKMTEENMTLISEQYQNESLKMFWQELKVGYAYFEQTRQVPQAIVDSAGAYSFF
jgi:murein L,D-transpeptidase YafK